MNLTLSPVRDARSRWAFTLSELMIAMSIFTMVIGGVIYTHIVGWRLNQWTMAKLGASDQSRQAFGKLQDEIRTAKSIRIGDGTSTTFTAIADGSTQQGTALEIYPTTNAASYIRYYMLTNSGELRRVQTGVTGNRLVSQYLTNSILFRYEDYLGNVLTESANNKVINVTLQFYQFQYPITQVGSNKTYDFYQLQSKITRRVLE